MSLRPLIIDTDPGGDDAQAIMLLAASGMFNIRAICAVHGNVGLEYTRRNALYLRDTAGLTCPVCQGASEALLARQPRAAYAHGITDFPDLNLKSMRINSAENTRGMSFMMKLFTGAVNLRSLRSDR